MKSACGICGRMEDDSLLIEQPYGWPAVCRECVERLAPALSPATPVQASQGAESAPLSGEAQGRSCLARMVPPFTLVEAAGRVAFWVKLIGFINVVGGIVLVCAGCAAVGRQDAGWPVALSGIPPFFLGVALMSAARWFMIYNMTLQDIGQRVRLNLPRESKGQGQDGGASEKSER